MTSSATSRRPSQAFNAAKNYRNDGDSVFRLFKDTVKGGDFRAREANVFRLAELSVNIIDQCVAQRRGKGSCRLGEFVNSMKGKISGAP